MEGVSLASGSLTVTVSDPLAPSYKARAGAAGPRCSGMAMRHSGLVARRCCFPSSDGRRATFWW